MINPEHYGLTAEDLEKAASVRLFEKAAAAEGINLSELSESQVEELYSNYQQSSEENTMNDELIDLFEKQAAAEGVDLESLNDQELAHVYNEFVNAVAQNNEQVEQEEEGYSSDEINAFLSEKTAQVYELVKEAADAGDAGSAAADAGDAAADAGEGMFAKARKAGGKAVDYVKDTVKAHKKKSIGGALATAAGGTYLYKRNKKKKEMEKEAAADVMVGAFDAYIQDHHDVSADQLDEETFGNAYNEFLDMVANDVFEQNAEEEEAYEKLAEAEILGRHMARAYMDEFEKEANRGKLQAARELLSGSNVRQNIKQVAGDEAGAMDKIKAYGRILAGKADNAGMTAEARKSLGAQLAAASGVTAAGVGGKKMYDKKKEQSKEASILEAQEYLIDQGINPFTGEWLTEDDIYELEKEAGKIRDAYEGGKGAIKKYFKGKGEAVEQSMEAARKSRSTKRKRTLLQRMRGVSDTVEGKNKRLDKVKAYGKAYGKELAGVGAIAAAKGSYELGKKKGQEKKASSQIEELAFDRANEFIEFGKEAGFDGSLIDGFAVEILEDHGYDVSPLFE